MTMLRDAAPVAELTESWPVHAVPVVADHLAEQGWELLADGTIAFEDTGEILPSGAIVEPHPPRPLTERWLPVVGFEGLYQVSTLGRIRGPRGHIQRLPISDIYPTAGLCRDGHRSKIRVHKLVLTAFVGPRKPGQVCRHLDGNKRNNRLTNLAWGTPAENSADAVRHGTQSNVRKRTCMKGHPFDMKTKKGRACRTCSLEYHREYKRRRRALARAERLGSAS